MEGSGLEEDQKNNRKNNLDIAEKLFLVELIREHKDDLENKDNTAPSNRRKERAWLQVETDFQARFGTKRDLKGMVAQWRRFKGGGGKKGLPQTSRTTAEDRRRTSSSKNS